MLEIIVRDLQINDLDQACDIHLESIPYSINCILGKEHLKDVYEKTINHHKSFAIGAFQGSNLLGVATFSNDYKNLKKTIEESFGLLYKIQSFFTLLLKAPRELVFFLIESTYSDYLSKSGYLMSICVDKNARGKKVGALLLQKITNELASKYFVETRKHNIKAINFYQKNGFTPLKTNIRDIILYKENGEQIQ